MSGAKESRASDRGAVRLKKIGKYELMGKIAQGGMGALYKARHPTLQRVVLLKKLALEGGEGIIERFRREARLMMDLNSERIVQVFDHFKEGSHYYIVEEFVDGISLDALIHRERYLSNDAATVILYEVCRALKFAHDRQVIHRDIKPGNILISTQGEVKLADFGIATSASETDGLTKDGTMLGTPAYIPPRADRGRPQCRPPGRHLLSWCCALRNAHGQDAVPGSFTAETIRLIHRGKYVPPRRLNPRASRFLSRIAATCMRVKRKRRYQDLGVIIRLLEKRISKRDTTSVRRAVRKILKGEDVRDLFRGQRSRLFWPLAAAFAACLLAATGFHLYRQGAWYEYFEARRYGALVISARIESGYRNPTRSSSGRCCTAKRETTSRGSRGSTTGSAKTRPGRGAYDISSAGCISRPAGTGSRSAWKASCTGSPSL